MFKNIRKTVLIALLAFSIGSVLVLSVLPTTYPLSVDALGRYLFVWVICTYSALTIGLYMLASETTNG
jgi:hypothetical protein